MTKQENYNYYYVYLNKTLRIPEEKIQNLFNEYPMDSTVVKEADRREGQMIEMWGHYYLILYRSHIQKIKKTGWVGICPNGEIRWFETRKFKDRHYFYPSMSHNGFIACLKHLRGEKPSSDSNKKEQKMTKGEEAVFTALIKTLNIPNLNIVAEYEIEELRGYKGIWKECPRFDFAIVDTLKNKPILFVEFDGEQHYHNILSQSEEDFFNKIMRRDAIKNGYAFYNLIPLIRIPFGILDCENKTDKILRYITDFLQAANVVSEFKKEQ